MSAFARASTGELRCVVCGLTVRWHTLTASEETILTLLAEGLSNREIAVRRVVAPGTVKTQVASIVEKLHAKNRTAAAVAFTRRQLITQSAERRSLPVGGPP